MSTWPHMMESPITRIWNVSSLTESGSDAGTVASLCCTVILIGSPHLKSFDPPTGTGRLHSSASFTVTFLMQYKEILQAETADRTLAVLLNTLPQTMEILSHPRTTKNLLSS